MLVKICGTTTEEDALLSIALGADALGFIFAPSPRQVLPRIVGDIVKRLPAGILTIGVFRDEAPQRIVDVATNAGLRGVQLHGHEGPEETKWIRQRVPFVIKALTAGHPDIATAQKYGADAILLDNAKPGSGQVFDWKLAEGAAPGTRVMIAGGLTPENVSEAIAQARPWGVDAVTGVEREPGKKDPRKLRAFIAAAKSTQVPAFESSTDAPYDWEDETKW